MQIVIRPDLKTQHRCEEKLSVKQTLKQAIQKGTSSCTRSIRNFNKSIPTSCTPSKSSSLPSPISDHRRSLVWISIVWYSDHSGLEMSWQNLANLDSKKVVSCVQDLRRLISTTFLNHPTIFCLAEGSDHPVRAVWQPSSSLATSVLASKHEQIRKKVCCPILRFFTT